MLRLCAGDDTEDVTAAPTNADKPIGFREVAGKVGDAIFIIWSIVVNIGGGILGIGLLLNISGFGYAWLREPPYVRIATLDTMRQESRDRKFVRDATSGSLFPAEQQAGAAAGKSID